MGALKAPKVSKIEWIVCWCHFTRLPKQNKVSYFKIFKVIKKKAEKPCFCSEQPPSSLSGYGHFQMRPHLYKRPCPSVGWLVGWSVRPSVMLSSKLMKNGLLRVLNDLDSAGRGKKRDEEEGGMRRKEGQGGRRDGEEGGTRRVKK